MSIVPKITTVASDPHKFIPEEFKKIAGQMESQFIEYLFKKMESGQLGEQEESQADKYYKGLLTTERAKIFSDQSQGKSIKSLILDQIYPERYRNPQSYNAFLQSQKAKQINQYQQIQKME